MSDPTRARARKSRPSGRSFSRWRSPPCHDSMLYSALLCSAFYVPRGIWHMNTRSTVVRLMVRWLSVYGVGGLRGWVLCRVRAEQFSDIIIVVQVWAERSGMNVERRLCVTEKLAVGTVSEGMCVCWVCFVCCASCVLCVHSVGVLCALSLWAIVMCLALGNKWVGWGRRRRWGGR